MIISFVSVLLALFAIFSIWRLDNRVQKLSKQVDASHTISTEVKQSDTLPGRTTITSGKSAFNVTVPDWWGPLTKAADSDFLILPGTTQPTMAAGKKLKVTEASSYGSDSPSLFMMTLSDIGMGGALRGESSEFTIGKGDDALVGKKYTYLYPTDEQVGIGYTRYQNDRDYRYAFTTKTGKKLDIEYSVYGSDPRNLSDTVDKIVQSIVVK